MDTANFETTLRSDGFQEIETKSIAGGVSNAEHSHPFDVRALVTQGQISLTVDGIAKTYATGEVFTMAANCRHAELIGADGVSYVFGRRHDKA